MKSIELIFDNIGRAITSMAAVIFVLLMTISGMIFFSHTLFLEVFPGSMAYWEKLAATWLMALGWEFTVLITTCNTRHINKRIPVIMAMASGIIVLFFIQAFDGSQSLLIIAQRWFVGILAATINYIYAELFYAKWKERKDQISLPNTLDDLQKQLDQANRKLDDTSTKLDEAQAKLVETTSSHHSQLDQIHRELDELRRYRAKAERELTCPHCKEVQDSHGTLQAHKGYCVKNPNRRGKKLENATT